MGRNRRLVSGKRKKSKVFHRDMMTLFDQTNRFLNAMPDSKIRVALVFGSSPKSIHDMDIIEIECNNDRLDFPSNRMDLSRLRTICARKIVRGSRFTFILHLPISLSRVTYTTHLVSLSHITYIHS
mgnify:CR=1 FL=1